MPRSLSSQKRHRQSQRRGTQNAARRTLIKTRIRKVSDALTAKDVEGAEQALRAATKILDRSATRRTLHPNTVARRKSRLAKRINALKAGHSK